MTAIQFMTDEAIYLRGASVFRWANLLHRDGMYGVICTNIELAHMQGVEPGCVHLDCVVDDFGNLVRVQ